MSKYRYIVELIIVKGTQKIYIANYNIDII